VDKFIEKYSEYVKESHSFGDWIQKNSEGIQVLLEETEKIIEENKDLKERIMDLTNRVEDIEFDLDPGEDTFIYRDGGISMSCTIPCTGLSIDKSMPSPPADVHDHPLFNAIYDTIESWDVNVPEYYNGYCGANGSHAYLIYDAIKNSPDLLVCKRATGNK